MTPPLKPLPFDARNRADYDAISARIEEALENFRKGKIIFRSQAEFARHCKIDKATLHRRGINEQFNEIKAEHKRKAEEVQTTLKVATRLTADKRVTIENYAEREKLLIEQVRSYQRENSLLFDRILELEERLMQSQRLVAQIQTQNDDLHGRASEPTAMPETKQPCRAGISARTKEGSVVNLNLTSSQRIIPEGES